MGRKSGERLAVIWEGRDLVDSGREGEVTEGGRERNDGGRV